MVKRTPKSSPRKRKTPTKEAPSLVSEPPVENAAASASAETLAAPLPSYAAAPGESPAAPTSIQILPAEAPPENESAQPDFGKSIGEILGQVEPEKNSSADYPSSGEIGPTADGERTPIDQILRQARQEDGETAGGSYMKRVLSAGPTGPRLMLAALFALVLIFSAAAIAGVVMFYKKNGMPSPGELWSRLSLFSEPAAAPSAPADESAAPAPEAESVNVVAIISKDEQPAGEFPAVTTRVLETDVTLKQSFESSGEAPSPSAKARGKATIVNTTSRGYTFVARTRLLSKEGVLFRMTAAAAIPANGKVEVSVAADVPGPAGNIGPALFTIPGLPQSLQDDIYAESSAPMAGGDGVVKVVTEEDIAKAKLALEAKLQSEAITNFQAMLVQGEKVLPELVTSSELSSVAPDAGTEAVRFDLQLSMRFHGLMLPEKALADFLRAAIAGAVPPGVDPENFDIGAAFFTVQAYDVAASKAQIRAEAGLVQR